MQEVRGGRNFLQFRLYLATMNVSQGDLADLFTFFAKMKGEIYEYKHSHTVRPKSEEERSVKLKHRPSPFIHLQVGY